MAVITNIADLERIYKKRVPKMFHDYAVSAVGMNKLFRITQQILKKSVSASV